LSLFCALDEQEVMAEDFDGSQLIWREWKDKKERKNTDLTHLIITRGSVAKPGARLHIADNALPRLSMIV
jgi:hypothetical protein